MTVFLSQTSAAPNQRALVPAPLRLTTAIDDFYEQLRGCAAVCSHNGHALASISDATSDDYYEELSLELPPG
jgi:hypothetical protein